MALASRRTSRSNGIVTTSAEAITTYAVPGRNPTRPSASLRRRFARFLRTAFPTPRPATIPTCAGPESPEALITTNPSSLERLPRRYTAENRGEASATNGRPLGSEPSPTLEPAIPDYGATRASSHAGTIPVLSLTTPDIRLIRTLHNGVSTWSYGRRLRTPRVYSGCFGTPQQPHRAKTPRWSRNNGQWLLAPFRGRYAKPDHRLIRQISFPCKVSGRFSKPGA